MWLANWSENHTKILPTHYNNIGVTEGEFLVIFFHIFTGIFGQNFWSQPLNNILPNFVLNAANVHPILHDIANGPLWVPIYYVVLVLAFSLIIGFFLSVLPKSKDKVDATLQWFPVVIIIVIGELSFKLRKFLQILK